MDATQILKRLAQAETQYKTTSIRISEETYHQVQEVAAQLGTKPGALMRVMIEAQIEALHSEIAGGI